MMSLLRRLHFESVTMVVAHLKTNVSIGTGAEGTRKLPPVEKVARLQEQQARLKGLAIRESCSLHMLSLTWWHQYMILDP